MRKKDIKSKLDFNPWSAILTKSKKTIQAIVKINPNFHLLLLSFIYGFGAILGLAQNMKLGEKLDLISIIIPTIILAPLWGYIAFSVSSWFVFFTGKWLGGKAPFKHIRAAAAWSNVPSLVSSLLWILLIAFFGLKLFGDFTVKATFTTSQIWMVFSVMFVQLVASIWSLVIYINALSQVQNFSILRAISNIILSALVVIIILLIIVLVVKGGCSHFFDSPKLALFF